MPRRATFALGIAVVLLSAGSVGSQDPYRARSEAESAATARPVYAPDALPQAPLSTLDDSAQWSADRAPTSILPATVLTPSEPMPEFVPAAPTPTSTTAANTQQGGNIPAIPVVAPAVSSFVASHAATLMAKREVPVSWDPRAIAPEKITEVVPSEAQLAAVLSDDAMGKAAVAQKRLFGTVPDDIEPYFDLFMYVSKAKRGPLAQHMFVFQRDADGRIVPYAEWKVSTGREKFEINKTRRVRTTTPEGIFQLDPDRFHKRYWSRSWDNAPMHYAMFYDMMNNGRQTGLAIHAAIGKSKIDRLGRRDSAGCVRLAPRNAKELFYKVQTATRGRVPVLAVNEKGSTDRWGRVQRDANGTMMLQDGYRAVLFVENFDGREEISGPVVAYLN
jgi:lipoprotein-anchoring transpeptidase ErfK/SrfK